jgi:hypothetical protein
VPVHQRHNHARKQQTDLGLALFDELQRLYPSLASSTFLIAKLCRDAQVH